MASSRHTGPFFYSTLFEGSGEKKLEDESIFCTFLLNIWIFLESESEERGPLPISHYYLSSLVFRTHTYISSLPTHPYHSLLSLFSTARAAIHTFVFFGGKGKGKVEGEEEGFLGVHSQTSFLFYLLGFVDNRAIMHKLRTHLCVPVSSSSICQAFFPTSFLCRSLTWEFEKRSYSASLAFFFFSPFSLAESSFLGQMIPSLLFYLLLPS